MSLELHVYVNVPESLRRGKPSQDHAILRLSDTDLAALSETERTRISERLHLSTDDRYGWTKGWWLVHKGYSSTRIEVPEASLSGVLEAIAADEAALQEKAKQKAEQEARDKTERREQTLAVIRDRKTKKVNRMVSATGKVGNYASDVRDSADTGVAEVSLLHPDWPCYYDDAAKASPEALAWVAELEAANAVAIVQATREAQADGERRAAEAREKAEAEAKEKAEMAAWIEAHGSKRLKRMLVEGIECFAAYRDERLAAERPGWTWEVETPGKGVEPRNPTEAAFDLLDEARKVDPKAKLFFWTVNHEHDDCDSEDECPKYDWKGYAVIAHYMGREIVYGLPSEVTA